MPTLAAQIGLYVPINLHGEACIRIISDRRWR